jgi:hypothetical protein
MATYVINKNKKGLLWPLLLIFFGIYLLADNLNLLPKDYLASLWQWWPLVLIAIGLSVIFRNKKVI